MSLIKQRLNVSVSRVSWPICAQWHAFNVIQWWCNQEMKWWLFNLNSSSSSFSLGEADNSQVDLSLGLWYQINTVMKYRLSFSQHFYCSTFLFSTFIQNRERKKEMYQEVKVCRSGGRWSEWADFELYSHLTTWKKPIHVFGLCASSLSVNVSLSGLAQLSINTKDVGESSLALPESTWLRPHTATSGWVTWSGFLIETSQTTKLNNCLRTEPDCATKPSSTSTSYDTRAYLKHWWSIDWSKLDFGCRTCVFQCVIVSSTVLQLIITQSLHHIVDHTLQFNVVHCTVDDSLKQQSETRSSVTGTQTK